MLLDHLNIEGRFMTGLVSKVIKRSIKKSTGLDTDIQLSSFKFSSDDASGIVTVELNIKGSMTQEDFKKLLDRNLEV
jgi:hypothetical protein